MTDVFDPPAMAAIVLTSRPNPRLLQLLRSNLRLRHFSPRAKQPTRLPVVLTVKDVRRVLA